MVIIIAMALDLLRTWLTFLLMGGHGERANFVHESLGRPTNPLDVSLRTNLAQRSPPDLYDSFDLPIATAFLEPESFSGITKRKYRPFGFCQASKQVWGTIKQ